MDTRLLLVAAVLDKVRLAAAPLWIMLTAVAAVPLVPLTGKPTTLLAVGVTVSAAVEPGTWTRAPTLPAQLPHEAATPAPPDMRQEPVATSASLDSVVAPEAYSKIGRAHV